MPRPASPALKIALARSVQAANFYQFTTSNAPGAVVTFGGSAGCDSWIAFDWRGDQSQQIGLPDVLQGMSCLGYGGSRGLASRNAKTFIIASYDSGDNFMWIVQNWLGSVWSKPEARAATLSVQPSPQPLTENCKNSQCNTFRNLALDLAKHSNIYKPSASSFPAISAADKALVNSLPVTAGSQSRFAQIFDGDAAPTTIVDFEGQRLVARAGPGVDAGWRTDGLIHIELWRLQAQSLAPLAEFVFFPERKPIEVHTIDDWHPDVH